jgi:hypothetical protein
MNWKVSPKRGIALSDCDYQITWCEHPTLQKQWFSAYTPGNKRGSRRCIEQSVELEKCKAACEAHFLKHPMRAAA